MAVVTLFKPKDYQQPIIAALFDTFHKYVTACLSRRIGKSLTAKNVMLAWALKEKCTIGYVTPTGDLARKFIKEIVGSLEGSGVVRSSNSVDKFIEFANGSLVYFMAAGAKDNNRGSGFVYMIYDEAAYIPEETYMKVFKPMELQAKKVFCISTPNGAVGFFYRFFQNGNSTEKRHCRYISFLTTIEESGLYTEQDIDEIREETTKMVYEQEYLCKFLSGSISAFGDISAFLKCNFERTERLFAGIDFSGDGTDETVLTITNDRDEMILQRYYKIGNSHSIDCMAKALIEYKVAYCLAELNSMGSISLDYLKKQFKNIEGITTTNESKRDYVENVINNFENGKGGILKDSTTELQFNSFITKLTPTRKITYGNISDNIHDDRVISYCISCWAHRIKGKTGTYVLG